VCTAVSAAGSLSSSVARINKGFRLEIAALMAPKAAGQTEGRCRMQLLPDWNCPDLNITLTPAAGKGQPVTRTYMREELAALGTGKWFEISTGPVTLAEAGPVEVRVWSLVLKEWKKGLLFDQLSVDSAISGEAAGESLPVGWTAKRAARCVDCAATCQWVSQPGGRGSSICRMLAFIGGWGARMLLLANPHEDAHGCLSTCMLLQAAPPACQ
jgi:hypothetical protein